MDKKFILEELRNLNPWWSDQTIKEANFPKRREFAELQKLIKVQQIISLIGLRRIGKTVLLKQLIHHLLKKQEINPKFVCYFLFDDDLQKTQKGSIREVIYSYLQDKLNLNLSDLKDKIYIFLDEIHFVPDWQTELKRFYDTSPHLKFFISGSSSLFIQKKIKESLAGRIFERKLSPLSFIDFLKIKNHNLKNINLSVDLNHLTAENIKQHSFDLKVQADVLNSLYRQYLIQGQFPEIINFQDPRLILDYLNQSIIKKVVERDIPRIFDIDKIIEFREIFNIAVKETGNIVEYNNIARETGIAQSTVKKYLDFLQQSFLIKEIFNYNKSARIAPTTLKKIYTASTNFTCALYNFSYENLNIQSILGHLVETQVLSQLNNWSDKINFWRRRDKEVDFLAHLPSKCLPIEVKYSANIRTKDYKNLLQLMNQLNVKQGLVLSREELEIINIHDKQIFILPVWLV
ncbi:MAG: ATP-binding protein [Patescibacteria group bacterium]